MSIEVWIGRPEEVSAALSDKGLEPERVVSFGGFRVDQVSRFIGVPDPPAAVWGVDLTQPIGAGAKGVSEWGIRDGGIAYPETEILAVRVEVPSRDRAKP